MQADNRFEIYLLFFSFHKFLQRLQNNDDEKLVI